MSTGKLTSEMERAWRADEIRNFGLALQRWSRRNYYRTKLLEELDRDLEDYDRPLRNIHRQYRPFSLLQALKKLVP